MTSHGTIQSSSTTTAMRLSPPPSTMIAATATNLTDPLLLDQFENNDNDETHDHHHNLPHGEEQEEAVILERLHSFQDEEDDAIANTAAGQDDPLQDIVVEELEEPRQEEEEPTTTTYRCAILACAPLFMGYATLIALQERIRRQIGITDNHSRHAYIFGSAVGSLFYAALAFRLLHNAAWSFLRPRYRVLLAYALMSCSLLIILMRCYLFESSSSSKPSSSTASGATSGDADGKKNINNELVFIFAAYLVGGAAVGTFESNLVSCITPLGHGTKQWTVMGMPLGYNGLSIVAFLLFAVAPTSEKLETGVFVSVILACFLGAFVFFRMIPDVPFAASTDNAKKFFHNLKFWREWFLPVWDNFLALFLDMAGIILIFSVALYVFNVPHVPMFPFWSRGRTIEKNLLQALYNIGAFLGDFSARAVTYSSAYQHRRFFPRPRRPLFFLLLTAIGILTVWFKIAILMPLSMFLVMFANGSIYAMSTKKIDEMVPHRYNLSTLSCWLFVGDLGSVAASQLANAVSAYLGVI